MCDVPQFKSHAACSALGLPWQALLSHVKAPEKSRKEPHPLVLSIFMTKAWRPSMECGQRDVQSLQGYQWRNHMRLEGEKFFFPLSLIQHIGSTKACT